MRRPHALLCAAMLSGSLALASAPPLSTDRPDQSDSPFTVPRGLFQIETGLQHGERSSRGQDLTIQVFPQALFRIGVTDSLEVRLAVPGYSVADSDSADGSFRATGFADTTLGFKAKLADQHGRVPDIAFVGTLTIPSGDDEFSSDRFDPGFRFSVSHPVNQRITVGSNIGMFWLTSRDAQGALDSRSFLDWTLVAGFSVNDKLGSFAEVFGATGVSAEDRPLTSLGSGVTYLLAPRIQIDGRVTVGLSRDALDWTAGAGVSFRFPR